jgi:predicted alpha-1,6-mannanase (GH76 family)
MRGTPPGIGRFLVLAHALVIANVLVTSGCGGDDAEEPPSEVRLQADGAIELLRAMYIEGLGTFGFKWWNSANALEAVIDYTVLTGSDEYVGMLANTFDVNEEGGFLNEFYDDEGWWALTWIKAHDLTGEARYLEMAESIFADIAASWDDVCGGGVWWTKEKTYKNAITNELFLTIAARLYTRTDDPAYLDWAEQEWAWFVASGMRNADDLINDGLDITDGPDGPCTNNGQTTWTYNQGVVLGGLVALADATGDESLLDDAEAIADAAVDALATDGVLSEPSEPDCGDDGPQFKGIFMRNLSTLRTALGDRGAKYDAFIARQAESIRLHATTDTDQIGLLWAGPFDEESPSRQSSGLDAINAALALED